LQGAAEQHKTGQVDGSCEPPAVTAGGGGRRGRGQAHPPVPRPPIPRLPPARSPRPSLPSQNLPDAAAASCHRTAAVLKRGRVQYGVRGDPGHVFPDVVSKLVVSACLRRAVSVCREVDTLKRRQAQVSLCWYGTYVFGTVPCRYRSTIFSIASSYRTKHTFWYRYLL
jgi:hypothetical protein